MINGRKFSEIGGSSVVSDIFNCKLLLFLHSQVQSAKLDNFIKQKSPFIQKGFGQLNYSFLNSNSRCLKMLFVDFSILYNFNCNGKMEKVALKINLFLNLNL